MSSPNLTEPLFSAARLLSQHDLPPPARRVKAVAVAGVGIEFQQPSSSAARATTSADSPLQQRNPSQCEQHTRVNLD